MMKSSSYSRTEMNKSPYSRADLITLMHRYHIAPKKRWGQNFLIDRNSALKIINALPLQRSTRVWEVGAGFGALTELLYERNLSPVLFEIDRGIIAYLLARWSSLIPISDYRAEVSINDSSYLMCGDALKILPHLLDNNTAPDILLGNLPYSVAAKLLLKCACHANAPPLIAIMIQREIAERITAQPSSKDYSSFSVLMHLTYYVEKKWQIPHTVFYPVPKVESTFLLLKRKRDVPHCLLHAVEMVVRVAFRSRRATLHKNFMQDIHYRARYQRALSCEDGKDIIMPLQQARAETLAPDIFVDLARLFHSE